MKCGYCGRVIKNGQKFCTNCGRSVSDNSQNSDAKTSSHKSPFLAVLMLIVLIIIVTSGGVGLIMKGISTWNVTEPQTVSPSSLNGVDELVVSETNLFDGDSALLGKWQSDDKSAVGYDESDYEKETQITLTFDDQGKFSVNYRMKNLGITARNETLRGSYSTEDGSFTLMPNLSSYKGDYFDSLSKQPTIKYSVNNDKLTILTDNSKELIFTKIQR